jgi:hypothetical protein
MGQYCSDGQLNYFLQHVLFSGFFVLIFVQFKSPRLAQLIYSWTVSKYLCYQRTLFKVLRQNEAKQRQGQSHHLLNSRLQYNIYFHWRFWISRLSNIKVNSVSLIFIVLCCVVISRILAIGYRTHKNPAFEASNHSSSPFPKCESQTLVESIKSRGLLKLITGQSLTTQ